MGSKQPVNQYFFELKEVGKWKVRVWKDWAGLHYFLLGNNGERVEVIEDGEGFKCYRAGKRVEMNSEVKSVVYKLKSSLGV